MSTEVVGAAPQALGRSRTLRLRGRMGRGGYLVAAVCLFLCALMVMPIILAVAASLKTTEEAALSPPTYFPSEISFDSYVKLWNYQSGLPTYLFNSFGTAALTIALCLLITIPAGYALARYRIPAKELLFVFLLLALIVPYQALLTPIFLMFSQLRLTNSIIGLAILHTTIQLAFSLYVMRNAFESVPRELDEAAVMDGANSFQVLTRIFLPAVVPAIVTVALFAFITSWNEFLGALVMMNKDDAFTLPLIVAAARTKTSLGATDWGLLQAGVTVSMLPCIAIYLLLQRYYVSGLTQGAVK